MWDVNMFKKFNIFLMILGVLLIGVSLYIGYINNFQGSKGSIFLILGGSLTFVGFMFTPKIWGFTANVIDMIVMFFSRP